MPDKDSGGDGVNNPLAGLFQEPEPVKPWRIRDGRVSSVGPLAVVLDGDTDPVEPTKAPLVAGLANGQRVCCLLVDRQLIILGRYGG